MKYKQYKLALTLSNFVDVTNDITTVPNLGHVIMSGYPV